MYDSNADHEYLEGHENPRIILLMNAGLTLVTTMGRFLFIDFLTSNEDCAKLVFIRDLRKRDLVCK